MTYAPIKLIVFIWRELPLFWKYCFLVAVAYTLIFFLAPFSVLLFSLDFLMPLILAGFGIFVFKVAVGWRKYRLSQTRHEVR
jgi:hypothetical protein